MATNDVGNRLAAQDQATRAALESLAARLDRLPATTPTPAPAPAPVINRASIAAQFLAGRGLEIGALHRPLSLPPGTRADYLDKESLDTLVAWYPEVSGIQPSDIIDDGEHLSKVPDGAYDFIVANHFFEHTEDPFATLKNFVRVLRPGGRIFMAIPDKRWTFDRDRPATPLDHILADHRDGPEISRRVHYEEWLSVVKNVPADALAPEVERHIRERVNIHFHVWTIEEMAEMFLAARRRLGIPVEVKLVYADPPMLEVIWILEITARA